MSIRIGTSGFSFRDWVGPFYPERLRPRDMLAYYASQFSAVEINSTYYRIPPPETFARMVDVTGPEFEFMVKAHRSATHDRREMAGTMPQFLESISPLIDAGSLRGVLFQFPWAFRHGKPALEHLARARAALGELPMFVEFRHAGWARDDVFAFLERHEIGYCVVDEPDLDGLMPPVVRTTTPVGYLRFHGRNRANWWGGGGDRYDYAYSRDELAAWTDRIRAMVADTERVYAFFNNCHAGHAVAGARLLAALWIDPKTPLPSGLVERHPNTGPVSLVPPRSARSLQLEFDLPEMDRSA